MIAHNQNFLFDFFMRVVGLTNNGPSGLQPILCHAQLIRFHDLDGNLEKAVV